MCAVKLELWKDIDNIRYSLDWGVVYVKSREDILDITTSHPISQIPLLY